MRAKLKEIPAGVMHIPNKLAWAQLTTLREHKKMQDDGIMPVVIEGQNGTTHNPIPVSRATTLLRRAYPYIFDCACYALTHSSDNISEDEFYKRFTMPVKVFFEYCLDDCHDQRAYLEKEIYEILLGEKSRAKYIKVSTDRIVLGQPIIITFSQTDLKTGKDKRIKNIGKDKKIDKVQIQILKELMPFDHGYLNVPQAFYAKTRRIYAAMRENLQPFVDNKDNYWGLINHMKSINAGDPIDTPTAARHASKILEQGNVLMDIEQGDFHKMHLALEYILVKKRRNAKKQSYTILELCEKCAPEYTQEVDGKLYFKDKTAAFRFMLLVGKMVKMFAPKDRGIMGIEEIYSNSWDKIQVTFA